MNISFDNLDAMNRAHAQRFRAELGTGTVRPSRRRRFARWWKLKGFARDAVIAAIAAAFVGVFLAWLWKVTA